MSFEHCQSYLPPTRYPGCQDHCPYYAADIAKHRAARKEEQREAQEKDDYLGAPVQDAARAETEKIKGAKKMNAKDTAERIRGLRTSAGMSQASFAAMCGIEQGQLCNYEMARIMPTIPLCERICRAVGINLLDFLREDDEGKSGIPTEERIGEKVKALRLMRGMNQTELAEKSGVADSTISSIERGERYGIVTTYLYLAEALDVSIAALLGGE